MIHVHFHTDCHSFSGSETTLVHLLTSLDGSAEVRTTLTYRPSEEYDEGIRRYLPADVPATALALPDATSIAQALTRRLPRPLGRAARAALLSGGLKQACLVVDTVLMLGVLRRQRPDLVQVNNGGLPGAQSCTATALAARLLGLPTIYHVHNLAFDYRKPWRWLDWPVERLLARSVDVFVTGSSAAGVRLRRVLGRTHGFEVIRNAVRPQPARRPAAQVRTALGIRTGAAVILVVARLEARKGHTDLLDAVAGLQSTAGKAAVLVIAGDGPHRPVIEQRIADLGLRERVRLVGFDPDPWSLYGAADLVVLPSIANEDLPITVLEAMACARPVIATRIAGIPEQIENDVSGLLVEPRAPRALAAGIDALLSDPVRAKAMGDAGRRRFAGCFSPNVTENSFRTLWARLLERPAGSARQASA